MKAAFFLCVLTSAMLLVACARADTTATPPESIVLFARDDDLWRTDA